jgi:hypothetical protein
MTFLLNRRLMVMKRTFFSTVLLLTGFLLHAQREKDTLYGFQHRIIPGARAAGDIDETGKLVKKETTPSYHYSIYLATTADTPLQPVQLWINGQAFSFNAERVNDIPVRQSNLIAPANADTVLIPKTGATVYQLTPMPLAADKSSRKMRTKAKENAVVVCYKNGTKWRYAVLKKFTDLGALSLQ